MNLPDIHLASIGETFVSFIDQGGDVLLVILPTTFALWYLITERQYFFWRVQARLHDQVLNKWLRRSDRQSWYARQIRRYWLSAVGIRCEANLNAIKTIVVIAPLLGLLGTVTGMIEVFDAMAATSSSNARAMAAGVSRATVPTMAGMVVSLSGILFSALLQQKSKRAQDRLASALLIDH